MHKKFEINRTKIKGGCQSGRKVVTYDSTSDLPPVKVMTRLRSRKRSELLKNVASWFGILL